MNNNFEITSVYDMLTKLNILREKYVPAKISCWGYDSEKRTVGFAYRGISNKEYKLRPRVLNEKICTVDHENYRKPLLTFQRESSSYLRNICGNDELSWMLYAQHYGVPTRLLDFSTNPLVALYFACQDQTADGALWIINIDTYEYETVTEYMLFHDLDEWSYDQYLNIISNSNNNEMIAPIYITPEYIDIRMNAQASRFMLWPNKRFDFEDIVGNNYMTLDTPDSDEFYREYALKLIIPKSCKSGILYELDLLGTNEKNLFPGLDSIGKYINFLYTKK